LRRTLQGSVRYSSANSPYIHKNFCLLYSLLKIIARLAIPIFCRKIVINKPELLKIKGPVLLACNHPNSFLDSIILDTLFQQSVWSLARGDAFKNKIISRILTALKILPVYRTSEGVENLSENYKTFDACISIFKQKGIVTIFSEGKCINEWHLRPLKKGTARLAIKAWEENIPLTVIPVGLNYSSFTKFGKNVFINFGEPLQKQNFSLTDTVGQLHLSFNDKLQAELKHLIYEIPKEDKAKQKKQLTINTTVVQKAILFIPAVAGFLFHIPIYLPIKRFVWKRTRKNDHYDSIMTGILMLTYPFYLLLITIAAFLIFKSWWALTLLIILPFTAWAYVQLKSQTA
jgi:1-acyl-sn-glycerol-3-phosphate acyltransferase